ncbi:MAG: hypothetical protein LBS49_01950 [Candidatus Accumulibacter sp.]|jgi:hypothetical protein|nr:hypothetical protein [Accumulibacter sp.]
MEGYSPLLFGLSDRERTELFLKSGGRAKVNLVTGSGWTPLTHAASDEENADAVPLLLRAGADPRQADGKGRLPLDVALENKNGKARGLSHGRAKRSPGRERRAPAFRKTWRQASLEPGHRLRKYRK